MPRGFIFLVCIVFFVNRSVSREWSDVSGKFRMQAELVSIRGDRAILEKTDGTIIAIPIEKLSQADRDFLKRPSAPMPAVAGDAPAHAEPSPAAARVVAAPAPASTQSASSIAVGDGVAMASHVTELLRAACYRCHGEDGASEGGFNFVANLEKLARTIAKPGDVAGSQLMQRISADDDGVMPPVGEEPRLATEDIAAIESWIRAGSPVIPAQQSRPFITNEQLVESIHSDLRQQGERSRRFMRYFTLSHLYNAGVSEDELQTYRNAFAKLINSLSWNTSLVTPRPIDAAQTVFGVDIRELHWNGEMWNAIEQANPYFLRLETPAALACFEETQTGMPYVRVDWFVFAASKPPLYHVLLNLPDTDGALEDLLRVNVQANIEQEQAIRAAFNRSGVSQNNRLIEWHKSPYGSYWKSYDFGGSIGRQNLFQYPLGPHGDHETFKHDGGEIIFSLPNGLQGYLLVDESGRRIDQGPTNIVSDPKRPDKTVTNGVSCMSCHYTGVIAKRDEVGSAVRANRSAFAESEDILALYRDSVALDEIFTGDGQRFAATLGKLGITSLSRSGEPVSAMAARFDQEVDLPFVACEFGLRKDDFLDRLRHATTVARTFSSLLIPGGTMKRDALKSMFSEAAVELKLTSPLSMPIAAVPAARSPVRVPSASMQRSVGKESSGPQVACFKDLTWGVSAIAFSPNGTLLAAGKPDRALQLFDIVNHSQAGSIEKLETLQKVTQCVFTSDGRHLIVAGTTGQILVYAVSPEGLLREVGQFAGHSKEITSIAVSIDDRFVLSGEQDKRACYWELESGNELASITGFEGAIKAVHIARDGRSAQMTDGATLIEYDLNRNEVKRQRSLTRSWSSGQAAAFSPRGDMVAVGDTYNIRLWDTHTGREQPPLVGNEIQWSMRFTPDGSRLLSGGSAKVNVWDTKKSTRVHLQAVGASGYIQALAVSSDGKQFAAPGSSARDLYVFRLSK